jgi:hypothetical protein
VRALMHAVIRLAFDHLLTLVDGGTAAGLTKIAGERRLPR